MQNAKKTSGTNIKQPTKWRSVSPISVGVSISTTHATTASATAMMMLQHKYHMYQYTNLRALEKPSKSCLNPLSSIFSFFNFCVLSPSLLPPAGIRG